MEATHLQNNKRNTKFTDYQAICRWLLYELVFQIFEEGTLDYGKSWVFIQKKTFCKHPSNEKENIYTFADAPHVLKLTRNWLLDTGFFLSDGRLCNKKTLVELISQERSSDLKVMHELKENHIFTEQTKWQNARQGARRQPTQLDFFYYSDRGAAETLANVTDMLDHWWHIMNSYTIKHVGNTSRKPYGKDLTAQDELLDSMLIFVEEMRCCNKKCLQIRTQGNLDDHPTPLNALSRMKMTIINNANTENSDSREFFVSRAIKEGQIL
ncbi:hypothetical protein PR048_006380 [Dryococelus australis]|uniref:Transposase n=1 Tax=Dryococelus australis TaxID=614101 RepID=A0ABQ9IAT3_9NEOP|nr:hypothetical protein PR048_006380 [Dryococelus australis]